MPSFIYASYPAQGTLTVALHHLDNARSDQAARDLAEQLNASDLFP